MSDFDRYQDFIRDFEAFAMENAEVYRSAEPFPHIVIDNLFNPDLLNGLLEEFPEPNDSIWHHSDQKGIQVKLRTHWKSEADIQPRTREFVRIMNSGAFLRAVSKLTGIEKLIPDPYLTGGGLNCILPGGELALHCDGNWHDDMGVHRRLNMLVYLNKDWEEDWGGHLELWDNDLTQRIQNITPHFNRIVIFTTHDYTMHGHPRPLACPEGQSRKSIIFYYYTSEPRPTEEVNPKEVTFENGAHRASWKFAKEPAA